MASPPWSGNTLEVGATFDRDNGKHSGAAYVFERLDGVWTQTAKLLARDGTRRDLLGTSVAFGRDTAVAR